MLSFCFKTKSSADCYNGCIILNLFCVFFPFVLQRQISSPELRIVVALKNFIPQEETDIPLHKDEEYIVIDCSEPNWWTVKDKDG